MAADGHPARAGEPCGGLVIDKAAGMTSHDVVASCRRLLGLRRVGHAGTLDPDATGVLVIGLGRATRLLRFVVGLPKVYEGEVVLGTATATQDASGAVVATWDMSAIGPAEVRRAATGLVGDIDQVPPMVSAVKVGGRRLYELARRGVVADRSPRRVSIYRFEVAEPVEPGVFPIVVECSAGTYVRSLADEVGRRLGGGAHLRHLRRLSVGSFHVDRARRVEEIALDSVIEPIELVGHLGAVAVSDGLAAAVTHGARLDRGAAGMDGAGPWAVTNEAGDLLAIYEDDSGPTAKPTVVLAAND